MEAPTPHTAARDAKLEELAIEKRRLYAESAVMNEELADWRRRRALLTLELQKLLEEFRALAKS